jgi:heme-degrading monooxygenase HmoA
MIRVLIERHIAADLEPHYDRVARETLQKAMLLPGFISGEALHNVDDPNHRLVLATYRSENDWEQWFHSDERRQMMQQIGPMLEGEKKITVFGH